MGPTRLLNPTMMPQTSSPRLAWEETGGQPGPAKGRKFLIKIALAVSICINGLKELIFSIKINKFQLYAFSWPPGQKAFLAMTSFSSSAPSWCKRLLPGLLGLGWLVAAAAGIGWMWQYAATPGDTHAAPCMWPAESQIARAEGLPSLVLFAHPRCPCTRATLGELAVLMMEGRGRVRADVVFYRPAGSEAEWAHTDLWDIAAAIPGVNVQDDEGGTEAACFHATVSGQALLYAADGRCQFNGGITASRGHAGDNAGRAGILALLRHAAPDGLATPVFGCSLLGRKTVAATTSDSPPGTSLSATFP